jgi:glyoxylase-like metal-dependent hydrolase (beta-lactamase superfamily II)
MKGIFVVLIAATTAVLPASKLGVTQQQRAAELDITMVGNAGVMLTDGDHSILIDLPYQPGAYGYAAYEPDKLDPPGSVTSVITHHHLDHFDPDLVLAREEWKIIGPPSVTGNLPSERVIPGDSISLGAFQIVALPTEHTDDHRSYRIYWHEKIFHFSGDAQVTDFLGPEPQLDLLFVTPWLSCMAAEAGVLGYATREIVYHLDPAGGDTICGDLERLEQGSSFTLER